MADDKGKGKEQKPPDETESHATIQKTRSKSGTKPRASRAGTRSVSTLSVEQLVRKRANDREAQRAIRQRTREHVERLEGRIRELSGDSGDNSDAESALAEAQRRNSDLEEELRILRAALAGSVSGTASPDLNYPQASGYVTRAPSSLSYSGPWTTQDGNAGPVVYAPTPTSAPRPNPSWSTQIAVYENQGVPKPQTRYGPAPVLGPSSVLPRLDSGYSSTFGSNENVNEDGNLTPNQHVQNFSASFPGSTGRSTPYRADRANVFWATPGESLTVNRSAPQPASVAVAAIPEHPAYDTTSYFNTQPSPASWDLPLCISRSATLSDDLMMGMIQQMRRLRLEGVAGAALLGPSEPSLVPLLQPENPRPVHAITLTLSEMLRVIPLRGLAEKVGILVLLYPYIQWIIAPSNETYQNLPQCYIPQASQLNIPHPLWVSMVGWPGLRDVIIANQEKYATVQFEYLWEASINANWPYGTQNIAEQVGDDWRVTELFKNHAMKIENWSLDEPFQRAYPELREFAKFTEYTGQT